MKQRSQAEMDRIVAQLEQREPMHPPERACLLCGREALSNQPRCTVCGGYLLTEASPVPLTAPGYDRHSKS